MSIFCSNLPNDQDMIKALGSMAVPLPIQVGDCCFDGIGVNNSTILIAVERKKIGDLAQCVLDGRYIAQARTSKELGADVLCLVAEGEMRPNPEDGLVEIPVWGINPNTLRRAQHWEPVKPTITYSRLDQFLTEVDYLTGIIVKRSRDVAETAAIIKALWLNFQTPPGEHASLHTVYHQPRDGVALVKPNLLRRIASELPGIGWGKSMDVATHFASVRDMVLADAKEWRKIDGIGKVLADKVISALENRRAKQ